MRRRDFIAGLGSAVVTPFAARAQQTAIRTIGWLSLRSADTSTEKSILAAFRQGLNQTGYVEGRNLTIEFRYADGHHGRLPALAAELVRRQVEVLMTGGGAVTRVAQAVTTTVPIIFSNANDPVQDGIVKSLNRPEGNITGTYSFNTALLPKRLELLRQLVPNARMVGFLVNPNNASTDNQIRIIQSAARTLDVETILVLNATTAGDVDAVFASLMQRSIDGLVMGSDQFFQVQQDQVIALAARYRLPTIYEWSEFVRAGGLASYSADRVEMYRQMGVYVGRVLNGAKPVELPVMQPTKFELVINLKTARSLGLKISGPLQQLADEVIE